MQIIRISTKLCKLCIATHVLRTIINYTFKVLNYKTSDVHFNAAESKENEVVVVE